MIDSAALARHYSAFRVTERLLMTGHSHQAWPDVARQAHLDAFDSAARDVDAKWDDAYAKADRVRQGWARVLGDDGSGEIALMQNTHEALVRVLSALDWSTRRTVLTTDAEFHTVRRQMDRLAETGWVTVRKVAGRPVETVVERLIAALDDDTALVVVSSVYFGTSEVVPHLKELAAACASRGVELLVDGYHHHGIVPFSIRELGLERAFVTGGGYKYMQLGEGNCMLRFPSDSEMRPVFTGWFAEFAELADAKTPGEVRYGRGPARFAGATYDPVSHWRAAAVMDFFEAQGLTVERLRERNRAQIRRLAEGFAEVLGVRDPTDDPRFPGLRRGWDHVGGFLTVWTDRAAELHDTLLDFDVRTDFRGEWLRFGPAPYVTDARIDDVIDRFEGAAGAVGV